MPKLRNSTHPKKPSNDKDEQYNEDERIFSIFLTVARKQAPRRGPSTPPSPKRIEPTQSR